MSDEGGCLGTVPFGDLGLGVQTRLAGEASEEEPLWWAGQGDRRRAGGRRAFRQLPAAERSLCLGELAAASLVTVESLGQTRINSQDQLTAGW